MTPCDIATGNCRDFQIAGNFRHKAVFLCADTSGGEAGPMGPARILQAHTAAC